MLNSQKNDNRKLLLEHYRGLVIDFDKFLRDFNILHHVYAFDISKKNPYMQCKYHENEPLSHAKAKNKIFNLFVNDPKFLIFTELKSKRRLNVTHVGIRHYRFDILVINVPALLKFKNHIFDVNVFHEEMNIKFLKDIERSLICAIELDGTSHTHFKDVLRDNFFFDEYKLVTLRYNVKHLVKMEETDKESKARLKYSYFKRDEYPIYQGITQNQIVEEWRNVYRTKFPHLQ
jgi:hypothetical protein